MATTRMTLQDMQDALHPLIENDPNTPLPGEEDWNIRLNMINTLGISEWESQEDVEWDELRILVDNGGVLQEGVTEYSLEDDYDFASKHLFLVKNNGTYKKIPFRKIKTSTYTGVDKYEAYITGNPREGYLIKLGWTPKENDQFLGATLRFSYCKNAEILKKPSDVAEMSKPMYAVFKVAARIHSLNFNTAGYTVNEDLAETLMKQMKSRNEKGFSDEDDTVEGLDDLRFM